MSTGKIVQVIGAVVDIEFPEDAVPKINDALIAEQGDTVFEVQQQLGDGVVRTITMGSSEGLVRGMEVKNTGEPITVPVGKATLGRIMNVLGKEIDHGPKIEAEAYWAFTAKPPLTTSWRTPPNCWKPASRLLTCSARSPKAVKSVSSAAPVWAKPST